MLCMVISSLCPCRHRYRALAKNSYSHAHSAAGRPQADRRRRCSGRQVRFRAIERAVFRRGHLHGLTARRRRRRRRRHQQQIRRHRRRSRRQDVGRLCRGEAEAGAEACCARGDGAGVRWAPVGQRRRAVTAQKSDVLSLWAKHDDACTPLAAGCCWVIGTVHPVHQAIKRLAKHGRTGAWKPLSGRDDKDCWQEKPF